MKRWGKGCNTPRLPPAAGTHSGPTVNNFFTRRMWCMVPATVAGYHTSSTSPAFMNHSYPVNPAAGGQRFALFLYAVSRLSLALRHVAGERI
jgi:hypothetical protein